MIDEPDPRGLNADRHGDALVVHQPGEARSVGVAEPRADCGGSKGVPQSLARNIGTAGSTTSRAVGPMASACRARNVW